MFGNSRKMFGNVRLVFTPHSALLVFGTAPSFRVFDPRGVTRVNSTWQPVKVGPISMEIKLVNPLLPHVNHAHSPLDHHWPFFTTFRSGKWKLMEGYKINKPISGLLVHMSANNALAERLSSNVHFSDNLSAADIISRHTSRLKGFIY